LLDHATRPADVTDDTFMLQTDVTADTFMPFLKALAMLDDDDVRR
jgi:hypothetical protein